MKKNWLLFGTILFVSSIIIFSLIKIQDNSSDFSVKYLRNFAPPHYRKIIYKEEKPQEDVEIVANLPIIYTKDKVKLPSQYNGTCAKFPKLFEIKYESDLWQIQNTTNGTLHLFNAYVDDRREIWSVRILSVYDQYFSNETFYCQFWYDQINQPVIVKSEPLTWIWIRGWGGDRKGLYHSYMITCPLEPKNKIPMSVSIVEKVCDNPTNNLRTSYEKIEESKKKNFIVCVKGLNFPYEDKTLRLVEWIELLFLLGADKINFYDFKVHSNVQLLLDYYVNKGFVELSPITLVGGVSNTPYLQSKFLKQMILHRRLQEVLPYNDCFYKHYQKYKFVVLLDTDEVIVPTKGNWIDLMNSVFSDNKTSFMARNVYFLDSHLHNHGWFEDIPKFMHMLQHVYRADEYTKPGAYMKGFHDTKKILTLHNHYPFKCLDGCKHYNMDTTVAQLQHYRTDCVKELKNCDMMKTVSVQDTRVWRYKEELIDGVCEVLGDLGVNCSYIE